MKPILSQGLRDRRWVILLWSISIGLYIALNVLVYGSIKDQAQSLNQALESLPGGAKALFGGGDFLSPVGYLNSKLYYLMLPLLFTMLTITSISSVFSKEEQNGTMELLLARPVSRARLMLAKQICVTVSVAVVAVVSLIITIICTKVIDYDIAMSHLVVATAMSAIMGLLFGSVAWALLGLGKFGQRASVGAAAFVALGSYLITSLEGYADYLQQLAKLSPYHYYESTAILEGTYHWGNIIGLIAVGIILMGLGILGFRRRDLS